VHDTAYEIGREFFHSYVPKFAHVLEIGSQDVNGSLRDFAPAKGRYVGIDISPGPAVDVVLDDPYMFPFKQDYFDVVVSSSCFEHDQNVLANISGDGTSYQARGYIYLNAPSNGMYHPYPVDNWRFYPDTALALQRWARRKGKKSPSRVFYGETQTRHVERLRHDLLQGEGRRRREAATG
jgi:SAM-dependent methyltransferase